MRIPALAIQLEWKYTTGRIGRIVLVVWRSRWKHLAKEMGGSGTAMEILGPLSLIGLEKHI